MSIYLDETGTVEGFKVAVQDALKKDAPASLLIMSCDGNGFTPDILDPVLKGIPVPVIGGVFPAVIHGNKKIEKGTVVVGASRGIDVKLIAGLSNGDLDYEKILDEKIPDFGDEKTMLVFVDGFSSRIGAFIDGLFNIFGLELNYVGGGAGSLDMQQKPCLLTNEGLVQDSAVLGLMDIESGVGVAHGWESIAGPFKVTQAERNTIHSLDWQPAFKLYKDVVKNHSGKDVLRDDFFNTAKAYPFGIAKMGTERVVRDPLMVGENDALVCVGEVPQGSFVDILNGDERSLIDAAGKALALASAGLKTTQSKEQICIFMDCISRVLFLENRFYEELNAVCKKDRFLIGACTIGEIANSGNDYLEFYNKTSVAAILESI